MVKKGAAKKSKAKKKQNLTGAPEVVRLKQAREYGHLQECVRLGEDLPLIARDVLNADDWKVTGCFFKIVSLIAEHVRVEWSLNNGYLFNYDRALFDVDVLRSACSIHSTENHPEELKKAAANFLEEVDEYMNRIPADIEPRLKDDFSFGLKQFRQNLKEHLESLDKLWLDFEEVCFRFFRAKPADVFEAVDQKAREVKSEATFLEQLHETQRLFQDLKGQPKAHVVLMIGLQTHISEEKIEHTEQAIAHEVARELAAYQVKSQDVSVNVQEAGTQIEAVVSIKGDASVCRVKEHLAKFNASHMEFRVDTQEAHVVRPLEYVKRMIDFHFHIKGKPKYPWLTIEELWRLVPPIEHSFKTYTRLWQEMSGIGQLEQFQTVAAGDGAVQDALDLQSLLLDAAEAQLMLKKILTQEAAGSEQWATTPYNNLKAVPADSPLRQWTSGVHHSMVCARFEDPGIAHRAEVRRKGQRLLFPPWHPGDVRHEPIQKIHDISRLSIVFKDAHHLFHAALWIKRSCDLAWIQNSFITPDCLGYRDLSFGVRQQLANGRQHISEVRLHLDHLYNWRREETPLIYNHINGVLRKADVVEEDLDRMVEILLRELDSTDGRFRDARRAHIEATLDSLEALTGHAADPDLLAQAMDNILETALEDETEKLSCKVSMRRRIAVVKGVGGADSVDELITVELMLTLAEARLDIDEKQRLECELVRKTEVLTHAMFPEAKARTFPENVISLAEACAFYSSRCTSDWIELVERLIGDYLELRIQIAAIPEEHLTPDRDPKHLTRILKSFHTSVLAARDPLDFAAKLPPLRQVKSSNWMTKQLLEQDLKERRCTGGGPAFRTLAQANPAAETPMWQRRYLQKTAAATEGIGWDDPKLATLRQCVRHTPEELAKAAAAVPLRYGPRPKSAGACFAKGQSPRAEDRKVVDRHVRKLWEPIRSPTGSGEHRPRSAALSRVTLPLSTDSQPLAPKPRPSSAAPTTMRRRLNSGGTEIDKAPGLFGERKPCPLTQLFLDFEMKEQSPRRKKSLAEKTCCDLLSKDASHRLLEEHWERVRQHGKQAKMQPPFLTYESKEPVSPGSLRVRPYVQQSPAHSRVHTLTGSSYVASGLLTDSPSAPLLFPPWH